MLMKNNLGVVVLFFLASGIALAQNPDEGVIKSIFAEGLQHGKAYDMLRDLTKNVGPRLSGSAGAAQAVTWSKTLLESLEFDSVWLQPVMVPHWVRGQKETCSIIRSKSKETHDMNICALGGSVGTGPQGLKGKVIEVKNFKELEQFGTKNITGKIVFYNRPMDPSLFSVLAAYGGAVNQRIRGASEAAKYGAVGVIVRSMNVNPEDYPHTGTLTYADNIPKVPAVAISTRHADDLSKLLKADPDLQVYFETHCELLDNEPSFNVIGQIKGGEFKDEIIAVGGHLDSWDLAEGAHDDGAGCVHAIEAIQILRAIGFKPKRNLRVVLFMNEENGTRGGLKYAELAAANKEKHLAAIESDAGGFTPRGFSMTAPEKTKAIIRSWKDLLIPYGLTDFDQDGGGTDIGPLEKQGVPLIGFRPDVQRYFDYHHSKEDTFDKVSPRELELGAASIAALMYLIDQHGLSN
jgi:carboxypeptidase Q